VIKITLKKGKLDVEKKFRVKSSSNDSSACAFKTGILPRRHGDTEGGLGLEIENGELSVSDAVELQKMPQL
jgi:hypothetical protein